jgi:hypothetical protein
VEIDAVVMEDGTVQYLQIGDQLEAWESLGGTLNEMLLTTLINSFNYLL